MVPPFQYAIAVNEQHVALVVIGRPTRRRNFHYVAGFEKTGELDDFGCGSIVFHKWIPFMTDRLDQLYVTKMKADVIVKTPLTLINLRKASAKLDSKFPDSFNLDSSFQFVLCLFHGGKEAHSDPRSGL